MLRRGLLAAAAAALAAAFAPPAGAGSPVYVTGSFEVATNNGKFLPGTSTTNVLAPSVNVAFTSDAGLRLAQSAFGVGPQTVALWHFDYQSVSPPFEFADETVNGHSATPVCTDTVACSSPTIAPGLFTQCLTVAATDQHVDVPDSPDFHAAAAAHPQFTVEAWVQVSQPLLSDYETIVDKAGEYGLFIRANGDVDFSVNNGTDLSTPQNWFPTANFVYIAGVYDPTVQQVQQLYINGLLKATQAASTPAGTTAGKFSFGFNSDDPRAGSPFTGFEGNIDDVRISTYPMSSDEIAANYVSGAIKWSTTGPAGPYTYLTDPSIIAVLSTGTIASSGLSIATITFSTSAVFQDCSANNYIEFLFQNAFAATTVSPPLQVWVTTTPPVVPVPAISSETSTSLTWTWPAECGANYTISATTVPSGAIVPVGTTLLSSYTLLGLTPNQSFTMKALAFNTTGQSIFSSTVTNFSAAAQPLGSTLLATSSQSVRVTFGADNNPPGTNYEAFYGQIGVGTVTFGGSPPVVQVTTDVLIGMTTGVPSFIHLRAYNGDGLRTGFDVTLTTVTMSGYLATTSFFDFGPFYPHNQPLHIQGALNTRYFDLEVPANAFAQDYYLQAKDANTLFSCGISTNAVEIDVNPPQQPVLPVVFTYSYSLPELAAGGLNVGQLQRLRVQRYDPPTGACIPLVTDVDFPSPIAAAFFAGKGLPHTLTALVNHFSILQIAQSSAPPTGLGSARAYPNPLYLSRGGQAYFTFDGLPAWTSIRIYTLRGEVVHEAFADGTGQGRWDATNEAGGQVASGIYFVHFQNGSNGRTIKVAIER